LQSEELRSDPLSFGSFEQRQTIMTIEATEQRPTTFVSGASIPTVISKNHISDKLLLSYRE